MLAVVLVAAALGAIAGDSIAYWIGRRIGFARLARSKRPRIAAAFAFAERQMQRRSASLILTGRFIPVGRVAVNMTAGATSLPYRRFLAISAIAGLAWSAVSIGIALAASSVLHEPIVAALVSMVVAAGLGVVVDRLLGSISRRRDARAEARAAAPSTPSTPSTPTATKPATMASTKAVTKAVQSSSPSPHLASPEPERSPARDHRPRSTPARPTDPGHPGAPDRVRARRGLPVRRRGPGHRRARRRPGAARPARHRRAVGEHRPRDPLPPDRVGRAPRRPRRPRGPDGGRVRRTLADLGDEHHRTQPVARGAGRPHHLAADRRGLGRGDAAPPGAHRCDARPVGSGRRLGDELRGERRRHPRPGRRGGRHRAAPVRARGTRSGPPRHRARAGAAPDGRGTLPDRP
ncbi:DedA family protein [Curtobacterium poinsettiae]|uniref:DedA family protein n=1 Tax=Curtobacterium poinsettiae TaxID=159612 RepID=UPI0037C0CDE8